MRPSPPTDAIAPDDVGHVLVVEDEARNRRLMRGLLEAGGHRVSEAEDGEEALREIELDPPDAILLDVMMPRLDGFEVCRRIRGTPEWAAIPVLIITALSEREDRLKGIDAGATGFLTKPIDAAEVLLHVRNAVYAKRLYDRLQESIDQLREAEAMRDSLVHMVVHDMRSPLLGISVNLEVVGLAEERLTDDQRAGLRRALNCYRELSTMAGTLLDVNRLEGGKMPLDCRRCDLGDTVRQALDSMAALTPTHNVVFTPPASPVHAWFDAAVITRVVTNLVGNALKFAPPGTDITVTLRSEADMAIVTVTDTGPGIPPQFRVRAFEKFAQLRTEDDGKSHSTGLGLAYCRLAAEAHGGRVGLTSPVGDRPVGEAGAGSRFWFSVPAISPGTG